MTMSPQMGKLLMLAINIVFLLWAYRLLMGQYKDESQYQGSMGMMLKYFRQMQDAVNRTGEGNRQLIKQGLNFVGVPLVYILFSNWVQQRSLSASVWSIVFNAVILLMFGLLFIFSYRMIRLNEFYPDKWVQKRRWFQKIGQEVGHMVTQKCQLSTWESTVAQLANNDDDGTIMGGNHDYQLKRQIQVIVKGHETLSRDQIAKILDLQGRLSSPVVYTLEERMMLAMYFNAADQIVDVMAEEYEQKSDEEKHQEYLTSKHTQQVMFTFIALATLLPLIL